MPASTSASTMRPSLTGPVHDLSSDYLRTILTLMVIAHHSAQASQVGPTSIHISCGQGFLRVFRLDIPELAHSSTCSQN